MGFRDLCVSFGVFPVDSERLLLLAREAFDSTHQVFMIHRESLELIDSTIAFLHADYNLSAVGISNSHLFVGDNSTFSDTPNGFVAIELTADGFASREFVEVLDPVSLVSSMDGAVLLVSSGYGDALFQYLPRIGTFTSLSTSAPSALPGVGSRVARGSWKGSVLVPENLAIRLVSFAADSAKDEGLVYEAEGLSGIIGSVGISP